MIGEPTFADAILDRIVRNAYRRELDGPSMRKIKAAEAEVAVPVAETKSNTNVASTKSTKGVRT